MKNTEAYKALMQKMGLTPPILATLAEVNRSTIAGYENGTSNPPAITMAFLKLLNFLHERDRDLFLDYLVLTEMDMLEEGTTDPRIAAIYKKGKLRPNIREYLDTWSLMESHIKPE